jgi:hypothetical protein
MTQLEIRPRDRDAILQSLRAGVVPRQGLQHIQVGRADEIAALVKDLDRVADGGSAVRFVTGEYGAGKTFFLYLVRAVALEKKLVTMHADLAPDRRLQSTGGQARNLYAELVKNAATRAKPDGGALAGIVEKFVTEQADPKAALKSLEEMVGGYDFASVIAAYKRGHDDGNDALKDAAVRWLRGEYATKTEAKEALGVRTIVDDAHVYDQLKLLARFVRLAGYAGLVVALDEMVNLYKLANAKSRASNYEQVLRVLNDGLQGGAEGLGVLLGGTPEFVSDARRGLFSYPALASRLGENTFATGALRDLAHPVLKLATLTPEDLYVLLGKLRAVQGGNLLPDEALKAFLDHSQKKIGEAYFRTPRSTITAFLGFLAVLEQNPSAKWQELLGSVKLEPDAPDGKEDLAKFKL